jgi:hypothetical protein
VLDAALPGAATLDRLAASAESEHVQLGASRALVDLALAHRRGGGVPHREVVTTIARIVDAAMRHIPEEQQAAALRDFDGLVR